MRRRMSLPCLLLLAAAPPFESTPVDPLGVADDDFARHRDSALWRDLDVTRTAFVEAGAKWGLWRIASRRGGPLWVVPHDNENAAFAAALLAVRAWGGVVVAVDSSPNDGRPGARYNQEVAGGPPIDPNRHFSDAFPLYAAAMLADLGSPPRPIVALHTNARGYSPELTGCGMTPPADGRGEVSIRLCNDKLSPRPSQRQRWPFDDEDSLALLPHLADAPRAGWCNRGLVRSDFNVTWEKVATSDGSLSNYAVQRGLAYVNFETRDQGNDPGGIARARDRLVAMIDIAMERCLTPQVALNVTARAGAGKTAK